MASTALNGYCYGGPAHGEIFKVRKSQPQLTVRDELDQAFCYRLHNIPPGSEAWHWLPAEIASEDAMDFVIETIMCSFPDELREPEPEAEAESIRRVQRFGRL
jgi:hypothetical protein